MFEAGSHSWSSWAWTFKVAKVGVEFMVFLPPPPCFWDCRCCLHTWSSVVLEIEPRALLVQGRYCTNWATSLGSLPPLWRERSECWVGDPTCDQHLGGGRRRSAVQGRVQSWSCLHCEFRARGSCRRPCLRERGQERQAVGAPWSFSFAALPSEATRGHLQPLPSRSWISLWEWEWMKLCLWNFLEILGCTQISIYDGTFSLKNFKMKV